MSTALEGRRRCWEQAARLSCILIERESTFFGVLRFSGERDDPMEGDWRRVVKAWRRGGCHGGGG